MRGGDVVRTLVVGGLAALGGYLAGRNLADDTVRRERDEAVAEVARLREAPPAAPSPGSAPRAPTTLEPLPAPLGGAARPVPAPSSASPTTEAAPSRERPASFDAKDVTSPSQFSDRLVAFAASRLAEGPKGHLEILRAIDGILKDERLGRMLNEESAASRMVYPLLKFAVYHEREVSDFTGTIFRTMAETPSDLEGIDREAIGFITEGLGIIAPSAISEEELGTWRGYVQRTLQAPPTTLPEGLRANLNRLSRLLEAWAPPLPPAEILAKLESLPADPTARQAVLRLARQLSQEDWAKADVAAILGPSIAGGDWQALMLLRTAAPSGATLATLDARVARSGAQLDPAVVSGYLSATQRSTWALARGFIDLWLSSGGGQSSNMIYALWALDPRPTPDEMRDLAGRSDVSEGNRKALIAAASR